MLDIAADLMSQRGYAATSVAEIVGSAGVAAPALYWHFKNKQGILAAVMRRGAGRWGDSLPTWDQLRAGTPREKYMEATGIASRRLREEPQFLRLLILLSLERSVDDRVSAQTIREIRARARGWMIDILRQCWPALPVADAERLALRSMAFADGAHIVAVNEPEIDDTGGQMWFASIVADEAETIVAAQALRRKRAR